MDGPESPPPALAVGPAPDLRPARIVRFAAGLTSLIIATSAILYLGYHLAIACQKDDVNHLESTLVMAIDREVREPRGLYGSFGSDNPFVLIHAPLYYRMALGPTWIASKLGLDPVSAALAGGRSLTVLGTLLCLIATAWTARIGGGSSRAGWWSALIVGASPVFGSLTVAVRPDTWAIAMQTFGFALVLIALRDGKAANRAILPLAFAAFALGACLKQHIIVSGAVGTLLLLVSAVRGRQKSGRLIASMILGILIVAGYYGFEEWYTRGMMSQSVFGLARRLKEIAPASRGHLAIVFFEVAKLSVGMIALAVGFVLAGGRKFLGNWLDGVIWVALIAELLAMVPLCLGSEGAWVNYAMPAALWGAVLLGRGFDRILRSSTLKAKSLFVPLAALAMLGADARLVFISHLQRSTWEADVRDLLTDPLLGDIPNERRYFVGVPQLNRLHGRPIFAIDDWLYLAYEKAGMAEPRTAWIPRDLIGNSGSTPDTAVIVPVNDEIGAGIVPEMRRALADRGYGLVGQHIPYTIWKRAATGESPR